MDYNFQIRIKTLQAVENILIDKKDRALFLSNLITSDDSKKGSRLWRVNLEAIFENPKLMSEYPDVFSSVCTNQGFTKYEGKVLFVSGDRSQVSFSNSILINLQDLLVTINEWYF